jgi:hypothetical protein
LRKLNQAQIELLKELKLYGQRRLFQSNRDCGTQIELIPKKTIHLAVNTHAIHMPLIRMSEYRLGGNAICLENYCGVRRSILLPGSCSLFGGRRFIDVKGYGGNGRFLFLHLHSEGDLFCGMLMPYAKREFELPLLCEQHGIGPVQLTFLLSEIPEREFIRHATWGFALRISSRLIFKSIMSSIRRALGLSWTNYKIDKNRDELGAEAARTFYSEYCKSGLTGARRWIEDNGLKEEADGLWKLGSVGVVWRAVLSPLRVGDKDDRRICTPINNLIAKNIGKMVRQLLELGYYSLTPHPGNWTTAGEFVDFEDVVSFSKDQGEFREMMAFHQKTTLNEFIAFSFGEGCIGHLTQPFQEGFVGKPTSTQEVVNIAREVLSQFGKVDF